MASLTSPFVVSSIFGAFGRPATVETEREDSIVFVGIVVCDVSTGGMAVVVVAATSEAAIGWLCARGDFGDCTLSCSLFESISVFLGMRMISEGECDIFGIADFILATSVLFVSTGFWTTSKGTALSACFGFSDSDCFGVFGFTVSGFSLGIPLSVGIGFVSA